MTFRVGYPNLSLTTLIHIHATFRALIMTMHLDPRSTLLAPRTQKPFSRLPERLIKTNVPQFGLFLPVFMKHYRIFHTSFQLGGGRSATHCIPNFLSLRISPSISASECPSHRSGLISGLCFSRYC